MKTSVSMRKAVEFYNSIDWDYWKLGEIKKSAPYPYNITAVVLGVSVVDVTTQQAAVTLKCLSIVDKKDYIKEYFPSSDSLQTIANRKCIPITRVSDIIKSTISSLCLYYPMIARGNWSDGSERTPDTVDIREMFHNNEDVLLYLAERGFKTEDQVIAHFQEISKPNIKTIVYKTLVNRGRIPVISDLQKSNREDVLLSKSRYISIYNSISLSRIKSSSPYPVNIIRFAYIIDRQITTNELKLFLSSFSILSNSEKDCLEMYFVNDKPIAKIAEQYNATIPKVEEVIKTAIMKITIKMNSMQVVNGDF